MHKHPVTLRQLKSIIDKEVAKLEDSQDAYPKIWLNDTTMHYIKEFYRGIIIYAKPECK